MADDELEEPDPWLAAKFAYGSIGAMVLVIAMTQAIALGLTMLAVGMTLAIIVSDAPRRPRTRRWPRAQPRPQLPQAVVVREPVKIASRFGCDSSRIRRVANRGW